MRGQRRRQLLPLAHEPCHLLLGGLALGGHGAHPLAVGVERRVAEALADLGQAGLERMDLTLDVLETPAQLPYVLCDLAAVLRRLRAVCAWSRLRVYRRRRGRRQSRRRSRA